MKLNPKHVRATANVVLAKFLKKKIFGEILRSEGTLGGCVCVSNRSGTHVRFQCIGNLSPSQEKRFKQLSSETVATLVEHSAYHLSRQGGRAGAVRGAEYLISFEGFSSEHRNELFALIVAARLRQMKRSMMIDILTLLPNQHADVSGKDILFM